MSNSAALMDVCTLVTALLVANNFYNSTSVKVLCKHCCRMKKIFLRYDESLAKIHLILVTSVHIDSATASVQCASL